VLSGATGAAPVELFDVAGRRLRRLEGGAVTASGTVFTWDGRDGRGRIVAAGRYFAVTSGAGRHLRLPFQVVP
jgi:hypothetical protein